MVKKEMKWRRKQIETLNMLMLLPWSSRYQEHPSWLHGGRSTTFFFTHVLSHRSVFFQSLFIATMMSLKVRVQRPNYPPLFFPKTRTLLFKGNSYSMAALKIYGFIFLLIKCIRRFVTIYPLVACQLLRDDKTLAKKQSST